MAQGAGKKPSKPNMALPKGGNKGGGGGGGSTAKSKKQSGGIMKPQKAKSKSAADKSVRKYTAGMVAKTEQMLGARAGHLELIGKGRKKALADGDKIQKGGTRKFG